MFDFILAMSLIEIFGLITGALAVWLLIKQNIWTWPVGIAYIAASLYIFYSARLYADFAVHIFYLIMSFYGWYYWLKGGNRAESTLPVSRENNQTLLILLAVCAIVVFISGTLFATYTDADLPYWDNTTSILSLLAMWLQSRKKLESWALWLLIDILAVGIYFYKEIYFYSFLYTLYIGMAFMGYIAWHKSYRNEQ
jgi:nicotinamide mononucleotide transporter